MVRKKLYNIHGFLENVACVTYALHPGADQQTMGPLGDVPFGAPVIVFSVVTIETTKRANATVCSAVANRLWVWGAVRPHEGPGAQGKILKIHKLRHSECLIWHPILTFSPVAFV